MILHTLTLHMYSSPPHTICALLAPSNPQADHIPNNDGLDSLLMEYYKASREVEIGISRRKLNLNATHSVSITSKYISQPQN